MNKDLLSKVLIFVAGCGIGSVVTWKLVEKRYQQIAQEEIDSVKEALGYYDQGQNKPEDDLEPEDEEEEQFERETESAKEEINRICKEQGYDYNAISKGGEKEMAEKEMAEKDDKPYVISPEEFDENGYKTKTLFYYNDDVVTDDRGKVLSEESVEKLIGKESLTTFGQYESDSVFVRNDNLMTDYEILADGRNYHEMYMG